MPILKCHGCGREIKTDSNPKEFVCSVCGAVNVVPMYNGLADAPLGCLPPTGFEWKLPAGKLTSASGETIYVTAQGSHMTKDEFIQAFGCDPDIVLKRMRELGINGVEGYKNLSTLTRGKK